MAAIMALFKKIQGMQGQGQGQGQTGQSGQVSWQYSSTGTGTGTGGLGSGSMKVSGTSGGGVKNVGGAKSVGGAISFNDFLRQMQLQVRNEIKQFCFLCPHIERSGAYCFTVVRLSDRLSIHLSFRLHKLNMKT